MIPDLATLIVKLGADKIYQKALDVAAALGLNVTTWAAGDPTRSLYFHQSEILALQEEINSEFIRAGFLDTAGGTDNAWLILRAKQSYNVDAVEATFATCTVTLTNTGGGDFTIDARDLTFKNSATDKTYHNTSGGHLTPGPGTTLTLDVEADEAGSDSSAGPNEIDELVTTLLGVTVTSSTAAVGIDAEEAEAIRDRCRLKLGALSPNGPRDAYDFVARTPELAGTSAVTRTRSVRLDARGNVRTYLAGPSGAVATADADLVEEAINRWAAPLGITATAQSATNVPINFTYEVWLYESVTKTTAEVQAAIELALITMLRLRPVGGDVVPPTTGKLYRSMIDSVIRTVFPDHTFRVSVTAPVGDTSLGISEVPTFGSATGTINFVADP